MALPNAYLITTKNLESFFNSITSAQAPERFTIKFLENLEFKSTNDRLYVGILKALKFIDETGVPTQRYFEFLDQTQSKSVLADAIREAYSDLFSVKVDAYNLSQEEVKNKFKTLTQGQKSDKVLGLMAMTFKALADFAEWKGAKIKHTKEEKTPEVKPLIKENKEIDPLEVKDQMKNLDLCYNIQIHLPATRDNAVYDAIFKSLKDHLFK